MSNELIIDPEAIENLRSLNPDDGDGFLRDIVGIFVEDTPARIAELKQSLADGDQVKFMRAAHSIKGSSSNLGALILRTVSGELEHQSRHSLIGLEPTIAQLEDAYAKTKAALDEIVPPA